MKKILITFALTGILTSSCIDELDVNVVQEEFIIVVEGFITTRPGPHSIKLTRSTRYGASLAFEGQIKPITNAKVIIRDQNGKVTILTEKFTQYLDGSNNKVVISLGDYHTPTGFRAVVGNSYTLQIEVSGKSYYSTPELVTKAPEIDSLILKYKKFPSVDPTDFVSGVEVYSQWQDPGDEDNYYMWQSSGIYKIETRPWDHEVCVNFTCFPAPKDCCAKCWISEQPIDYSIKLMNYVFSNGNFVTNLAVFVTDDGLRYMDKYYVTIKQHSISEEAFLFFKLLNNQKSIDGDIFDPPPATIQGNMISLSNPDENVIGYFRASDVAIKSIFIPRDILGETQKLKVIKDDCRVLLNSTTQRPSFWD